jgi:hypothetical protein
VKPESEASLNAKGYSLADEKRILDALGRGLLKEFPNPNRVGCPGVEVLRKIATREMPLSEAEKWLDHLGSCSPCYDDFRKLRGSFQQARRRTMLAVAASILIAATAIAWWVIRSEDEVQVVQIAVVDLRNRSIARGPETAPNEPPLEIRRTTSRLDIFLPLGSSEGSYEVRIVTDSGDMVATGAGTAKLSNQITSLQVPLNISSAHPGTYLLQVRRDALEWNSYPLILK